MADRKRERSISESEYEYNDQTACETSTNKRSLYKSNALCKRTSEQSLSDVIQKLTQQIEHIEKNFAKCQNVTKNTKVNDISCDDELIYQPPNKIIKYDNDIISANFCNSDENSIGSTNKIDPTNHVNKKIKLDKNLIFQKDVDDLERDSKSLTNEEVETLLELSHKIDDKIIYEDNTCIKTHNVQTIENDSVKFLDQADNFNTTMEHVFNESMLNNNNISFSTEDQSIAQSNDFFENSINKSAEFMNIGDIILMSETCENNNESIDQDGLLDLTKCENDENILDLDKCRNVTNESINCTTPFENVNSEIQTDSDQKTQYSGDSIHETDIGRMIVQERKSCQSTMHEDDQETVCETLNNQEENIFEPSNAEDDSYDVNILEAVHPKIIDCENNFNQKDLLDINEYVNEEIMSENENVTCKSKLEQNNKGSLKILTIEDEEMLTKLVNNEDEELGIGTDCTDKTTGSQTCEDYINENIPKKRKNQDDLLVVTTQVSHENVGMVNEEKSRLDQTDKPTKSMNHGVDLTIFNNKEIDNLTERNSQSSVNGDQFISNTFYFGTENCRDVSVHTIHSLDAYEMNNSVRNNTTVHSIENNDSLVSLNNEIENSIVELYCNSDDKTLSGIKNKGYSNEEEYAGGIMKHTIEDILVSLESSNSYRHGLINFSKSVNDFENILEPVDESCMNSESITNISNTIPLYELQKTVSEINEYNNNTITSQSNESSEISKERSAEFVNVGDIILMPETCENNNESIDQDDLLDSTKCENDENILDLDKCRNVTNESINCTRPFENVNSEIQTDSDQKTQYLGDSIHETDIGRMIVQERKSCQSTMHEDDQETVCETLNNQEGNIFEPSNAEDDSYDVNILEAVHPKIIDCENNFNQKDLLDINEYVNEEIMSENENVTCKSKLEQNNKGSLKILTIEDEEMLTKLVNNEDEELGIGTDCTDKTTGSQTCEDYINENIPKNQDDLLVVTTHLSDENVSMVNEGKSFSRLDQTDKPTKSMNHGVDLTIFNNKEIDKNLTERSVSFNSSDARQILDSSNDDSEHFDDSLLFKPSDRDLVRYGIECEAYEKSISQSLNNLENYVSNKEVIPQCNTPTSLNNLVSSSYVKDYEDNVVDFYDCELSSIENSDVEDNLLLSFVKDTSMDDCILEKNQNKLKNATNSTSNELTCDTNFKIPNLGSPSESCNNLTNVVSLVHSPSHDHQNNEIISTSISKTEMQMNPDADDKLESVNSITSCNVISSLNDSDNINNIQSNNLCIDQGNFNENQNLEDTIKSQSQNNKNESISGSNTHQNIKKSQKSYEDNESETESSMKITGNCTIPKSNIEEIHKTNIVQSSSSVIDQSEIDKKKYLDEIIKNEQLFNKFDEKLDVNESAISPFISQSLAKPSILKGALAKKAAAHININDMGDKALSTYLTQQAMTLDVLEVLHKSLDTCPSSDILMEDPKGLVVPLMPHQKHAIAWLIWRECQEPHGGILADDMGLGKTLSMISLILKSKEKKQDSLLPVVSIDNGRNDVINGGTLVVCPASLINQWETEVKTKLEPGLLKVVQYYGMNRDFSALELAKNDLVITSYNIVMWDQKKKQNTSPLYRIKWDRIILDEGHNIRNHKTQTSVAVCNIKSLNRWAITGTPIHNKEADFFTLLKFVRCKPFDDWAVWKRWVSNNDDAGKHRLSLLVKTLMLRRTKSELTQFTTFNLPKKEINTIEIELSKEERRAYEKLLQFSSNLFATYLYDRVAKEKVFDPNIEVQCKVQYFQEQNQDKDDVFKDHPELIKLFRQFKEINEIQTYHILVLLLRLRQICCHPILIKGPITEESIKKEDNIESIPEDDTDVFNNDSYNENTDIDSFPNNIDLSELMSCLTLEDEPVKKKPVIESNIFQKSWISTKIKTICDLVNQKVLIEGNKEKAIIVSQWPSFLYLIRKHLETTGNAKMEMFSGAIPIPKRNKIIREFNQPNSGPQILLLSLKAGGVGLNLMAANHMFLVDIHWNPQLEAQACDRVYRVGQTKPVYVYKFICSNTIETRIMNIQTHKLQMADNLFKGTSITSKITIDDLKQIFQFH
ncbi:putative uncharacterized protein DDB_G0282133 isoform X2 [Acyrthosiphon pisum]|uniref:Transcription termination factor 2 n=1 Tax=Acyrthosiphon pisum TaxID=7029 RepID=A0A8R2H8C6_ACYPI|nr:putative uncharacterized protein DDB_G0282133 isoform X2 [Acyrthosiphon pisum]|eukprot:XP_016658667.1 PREDICTED: putative uncharacterized protein DDB_G0282133 isoform X3 [Acyrthosiphon pisum]